MLNKHLRLFGGKFPPAGNTVKTDFTVKMYLSTATLGADYILISRIKHFLSYLLLMLKQLLLVPYVLSAKFEQMLSYKVALFDLIWIKIR